VTVWAGMATITGREEIRGMAVNSILSQVDRLVIANGDERGDKVKFLGCEHAPDDAIFVGLDDDLIYPPDYIDTLIAGLERYPDSIVSFHGWKLDEAGECYVENYRCLENVWDDVEVHVAGTAVCAFHLSTIRPLMTDFESVNADVWLAVRAQERGIPRVVLAHPSYWIGYSQLPGKIGDVDGRQAPLAESVYTHTRYRTGSALDGSTGFEKATTRLRQLLFETMAVAA
jgi:hypothetical protein